MFGKDYVGVGRVHGPLVLRMPSPLLLNPATSSRKEEEEESVICFHNNFIIIL